MWTLLQFGTVFDDFYADCGEEMQAGIDQRLQVLLEKGNAAREPYSKHLENGEGLLESRPRAGKDNARLLFFFLPEKRIVIVAAVHKDQRKLNSGAIRLAKLRKKLIQDGLEEANEVAAYQ